MCECKDMLIDIMLTSTGGIELKWMDLTLDLLLCYHD
jgi:hypothetical protein